MYIKTNGVRLYFLQKGAGPQLVLLHGNGEDHTIFASLQSRLSAQFNTYAFDSRGHGRSSPVSQYHYWDMAEDIACAIQKIPLQQPALVGFSDGGIVGLLLALRWPNLISRLVVCGVNTKPSGLKKAYLSALLVQQQNSPTALNALMLNEPNFTARELHSISTPTLVLAGECDLVQARHTKALARALPNSRLLIFPNETHDSYLRANSLLYPSITAFLSGSFAGINEQKPAD